jgi:hypothetical protein
MNFNTHRNAVSLGARATSAKQWAIGWTADQVSPRVFLRASQDRSATPGAYGLLIGAGYLPGTRR